MKVVVLVISVFLSTSATADLLEEYQDSLFAIEKNQFNLPILLKTNVERSKFSSEVLGRIDYEFDLVRSELANLQAWCEILFLHLNTKACTYDLGNQEITIYSGRKFYQEPNGRNAITFNFTVVSNSPQRQQVQLTAARGLRGTSDFQIDLETMPLATGATVAKFNVSYKLNFLFRTAVDLYMNTLGRNKVGFTQISTNSRGEPVYVRGVEGILERNTMRYFLALDTQLLARQQTENFEFKIENWFDATEKYAQQLHELDKSDYISNKRQELDNQIALQQ